MKFKKTLSLLMSAVMVLGSASFAAGAAVADEPVGAYSNQNYLETYATAAYNETGLGSTYSPSSTTWKTWSPEASAVKVKLYKTGSDAEAGSGVIGEYAMTKNSTTGVWSLTLSGDHKNEYYTYLVTVSGSTNETQDVYSKATGVNGSRSMVVDLDSTDPDGWSDDKHVLFDGAQEAVVWEVHVRDFSISDNSGVSEDNKGKYLAFTEGGTTLNGEKGGVSTAVDYLVEQGINCVQLQPVYDFQSVDEVAGGSSTNRNWGYDPQNYNVPEGSYSSNAYDGNVRITEFKQMIQSLHDRGISVVMDVVYNHTYTTEGSCFSRTVPKYYYRMTSSSAYSNGSGCGNETASDKKMYRKYMIESVKYWAEEYHIDGFRFDLMGLHDYTTMNEIRKGLDNLYSDGSGKKILMYGEPWTGGDSPCPNPCLGWTNAISSLDSRVGMFCDKYRDAIKGDTDGNGKGFVQGNTSSNTSTIVAGVKGKAYSGAKAPSQIIAYADAHDNLILWDKIVKSNGSNAYTGTNTSYQNQVKEVMTLLLTSQGIPFMTAGSEFGRTKKGNSNSYNASDSVNEIDWSRVEKLSGLASYYKGLLQIRKNYSPLKGASFTTPTFQSSSGDVVAYTYTNSKAGEWNKLCVLVNGGSQAWSINLSGSGWTIVADGTSAGVEPLGTVSGSSYSVPAKGSVILVDSASFNNLKLDEKFGEVTINHVDDKGNTIKSQTAKYREGSTYRAYPDATILFDYNLTGTQGATTGTVEADGKYTVTFTYSNSGIVSGYVNVSYVDQNGTALKDSTKTKLREGTEYDVPFVPIQGYQLDTDKYPASSKGTFGGSDVNVQFVYKPLDNATSTVHYYNSNKWSNVMLYAYSDTDTAINGTWDKCPVMSNDSSMGTNWLVGTVNASSAYVMFHPKSGSGQEPGQGETGYLVAGEAWIQNKAVTFSSKIIVSHIDIATGKKISADVVVSKDKVTDDESYATEALSGRTDVIVPGNASGNYSAGVINVIYLYGESGDIPTNPTTNPTDPTEVTTNPTDPTTPTEPDPDAILMGDVDDNGKINIDDVTLLQKHIAEILQGSSKLTSRQLTAADVNGDTKQTVKDVTIIQKYIAGYTDTELAGKYIGGSQPVTQPSTQPTTVTQPTTAPKTEPTTVTQPTTIPVDNNAVYLDASAVTTGEEVWYAWTWGGNTDGEWVAGTDNGATLFFEGVDDNVIFVRMNPGSPRTPAWNNDDDKETVWNQTDDLLTVAGGTFVISGWGDGWGAKLPGSWS